MTNIHLNNGKIKKLLFFDRQSLSDPAIVFDMLWQEYCFIFDAFRKHHPVEIFVFFDLEFPPGKPVPFDFRFPKNVAHTNGSLMHFICINAENSDTRIFTRWVQDVIIYAENNTWLCNALYTDDSGKTINPVTKGLLDELGKYFPAHTWIPASSFFDGGGMVGGVYRDISYLIAFDYGADINTTFLSAYYKLPETNIFIPSAKSKPFGSCAFHADLFFSVVGPTFKYPENEIVLIAEPVSYLPAGENDEVFSIVRNELSTFERDVLIFFQTLHIPVKPVKIPFVFISSQGQELQLSYNNCIIENYFESGERKVRCYFPDFRKTGRRFIGGFEPAALTSMFSNTLVVQDDLPATANNLVNTITNQFDLIIQKCEQDILERLEAAGILPANVRFVEFDFYRFRMQKGALHCMAKVIEYDN